jgi:ribosome maturation factor RimP
VAITMTDSPDHETADAFSVVEGATLQKVRTLILPIVADLKLDLYDLEFRGGTLRITLDTPPGSEGGVNLDTIALATRLFGRELDHHDPVPGHYTLEVSSPGLERTLRTPAHFQREIGKTIAVRLRDTAGDARRLQGVLVAADDRTATVLLDTPGPDGAIERVFPIDQVDRARTVFVWGPTPKPGGKAAGTAGPARTASGAQKATAAKKSGAGTASGAGKKSGSDTPTTRKDT